jgi:membrane protease YdiL (CAAX protease family)
MFALGFASVIGLYFAGPLDFATREDTIWTIDALPEAIARSFVFESLIQILLLLPLAWFAVRRDTLAPAVTWSVAKAVVLSLLAAVMLRLPLLIYWLADAGSSIALFEETLIWELLAQVKSQFGMLTAFWLIVVAAPVAEEFVFRHVLLKVFSRQISFWAANLVQSILFAAMHMDASGFIYLTLMGLIAGLIARRSGGLLAPILFHAMFNLIAGLIFLV